MKTTLAILTALAMILPMTARAADNVTSNYFSSVVVVPAASTNAGDTGLSTNTAYFAVPLASLTGVTTGNVSDVRAVMYGVAQTYYTAYSASTNKADSRISRNARYAAAGTNVVETITHSLVTERVASQFDLE
jgi:hypothetical protein